MQACARRTADPPLRSPFCPLLQEHINPRKLLRKFTLDRAVIATIFQTTEDDKLLSQLWGLFVKDNGKVDVLEIFAGPRRAPPSAWCCICVASSS